MLDVVAENAARLCEQMMLMIYRVEGELSRNVAKLWERTQSKLPSGETRPLSRGSVSGRAILDRQIIHIHDMLAESRSWTFRCLANRRAPGNSHIARGTAIARRRRHRRDHDPPHGGPAVHRKADRTARNLRRPSRDRHRERALVQGIQERNAELREALEHQTATAEVLGIISRSPTDVQPVLDAIVESAARVCGIDDVVLRLHEGNTMVSRAHFGPIPIDRGEISIDEPQFAGCASMARSTFPMSARRTIFQSSGYAGNFRTFLAVPLRQQGELIGTLIARRTEVRPFTPAQIKLLETFADQAVIAIENVRLFKELQERNRDLTEALEQQTATSEILRVIASSPTDIQPVLDVVAENAARLCDAADASIWRSRRRRASVAPLHYGSIPTAAVELQRPITRAFPAAERCSTERRFTSTTCALKSRANFPRLRLSQRATLEPFWPRRYFAKVVPIGAIHDSPHRGPSIH